MHRRWASQLVKENGIDVKVTAIGGGNFEQKDLTDIAAELPSDVGTISMNGLFEYGKIGATIDIKHRFPNDYDILKEESALDVVVIFATPKAVYVVILQHF